MLRDHGHRATASHGVPVYVLDFYIGIMVSIYTASSLVTGTWVWKLAWDCYLTVQQPASRESNSQPSSCKSNDLTNRLMSHLHRIKNF